MLDARRFTPHGRIPPPAPIAASPRVTVPALAALLALVFLLAAAPGRAAEVEPASHPLTNEDVVRMVMAGEPAADIILKIRREPTRFDVEPDILDELRAAGVPANVISTMVTVTRKARTVPHASPAHPASRRGSIGIVFDDDPNLSVTANSVMVPEKGERPGSLRDPVPLEMAFVVVCTDPTHVPDAWAAKTILDPSFPRHRVIFSHEGQAPAPGKNEKGLIYADHPASWSFQAGTGVHRGYLVFAVRFAGDQKYTTVAMTEFEDLEVKEGEITRIHVRARTLPRSLGKKGGDAELPEPGFTSIGTVGRSRQVYVRTIEIVGVDPPAAPEAADLPAPD